MKEHLKAMLMEGDTRAGVELEPDTGLVDLIGQLPSDRRRYAYEWVEDCFASAAKGPWRPPGNVEHQLRRAGVGYIGEADLGSLRGIIEFGATESSPGFPLQSSERADLILHQDLDHTERVRTISMLLGQAIYGPANELEVEARAAWAEQFATTWIQEARNAEELWELTVPERPHRAIPIRLGTMER